MVEYIIFTRKYLYVHSDIRLQNFDNLYWKKYYIYHPEYFGGVFNKSWVSKRVVNFITPWKL